ncbi:HEPN domain-containing protein [Hymenobacter crusticola]|uniref:RiboL-PSP-HEPN domain-containing protein n=1 Tax=Hymenobacter crusticola TaxID=1770526 RepID=A0A243W5S6_9BACT|nr:MAE_28990/MAE_18760 family HEPN-like nuclease [Hymenobacter crusticola]OUJ69127.1 hypothetical protein BXP70_26960 [Hymenobacter crusticola]
MSTFINELNSNIEERWKDVNLLMKLASSNKNNPEMYDVLCRSTVLFISAHLESFIKDLIKAIINDINQFSNFKSAPETLKKIYCRDFTYPNNNSNIKGELNKDSEERMNKLLKSIEDFDIKFPVDIFLINNSYGNDQKNPAPKVIAKAFSNFGIKNPFLWLDNCYFEAVFSGVSVRSITVKRKLLKLKKHIHAQTLSYPYNVDISIIAIKDPTQQTPGTQNNQAAQRSFWETFVDNLLAVRHRIAHGSATDDPLTLSKLIEFQKKVKIIEHSLLLIMCHKVSILQ